MKNKVENFYNGFLNRLKKDQEIENPRHTHIKASLKRFFENTGEVLDLGCGIGLTTDYLRQIGNEATGVDLAEDLIKHAKKSYGGKFVQADILTVDLDKKYDAISLVDCLEHLPKKDMEKVFETIERHSKENSRVYINIPVGPYQSYIREFRPDLLQVIDEALDTGRIVTKMEEIGYELKYYETYGLDVPDFQYAEFFFVRLSPKTKDILWGSLKK